ncbi:uncharacterized protein F4812DRAFT_471069 [Daldinia caldariorum]|uniref:uncharacterized protein n=1 Tax=Daldinia caldariorum TaxID=326644 RepID=UPI0020083467|nr:uncharacterized protein F4812DRAFT_471069 [Daldinia caldariorum]KAI1468543.1 hypothetical protein F4812DRAFT_471069 [Daldinia caldariorum]
MTGKFWSPAEEKYFWKIVVAHSVKRAPVDLGNEEKTWEELAVDMQKAMDEQGTARRWYSSSVLFEHYFQNVEGDRRSPNATKYVMEYMKKLGPFRRVINPRSGPRGGRPRRREVTIGEPRGVQAPPPSPDGFTVTPLEEDDVFSPEYAARQARQLYQSRQPQTPLSPTSFHRRRNLQHLGLAPFFREAQGTSSEGASIDPPEVSWGYQMGERSALDQSTPETNLSRFNALLAAAEFIGTEDYSARSDESRDHFTIQSSYTLAPRPGYEDTSAYVPQSHTLDCASSDTLAYSTGVGPEYYQSTVSNPMNFREDSTSAPEVGQGPLSASFSSSASTLYNFPVDHHVPSGNTTEEEDTNVEDDENKENEGGIDIEDLQMPGFRVYRNNPIPIPQDFLIYEDGQIEQDPQPSEALRGQEYFDKYDNKENEYLRGAGEMYHNNDPNTGPVGVTGFQGGIFDVTEELSLATILPFSNW